MILDRILTAKIEKLEGSVFTISAKVFGDVGGVIVKGRFQSDFL